jgi:hypothetical protein
MPVYFGTLAILLLSIFCAVFTIKRNRFSIKQENITIYSLFLLLLIYSIFLLLSQPFKGYPIITADIQFTVLLVKDLFIFIFFYEFFRGNKLTVLKIFVLFSLFSVIICITQYFNFGNLNSYYFQYITSEEKVAYYKTLTSSMRVMGLTANPNEQAFIASMGTLASIALFYLEKKKSYILKAFIIGIGGVFLTGSRTGTIGLLLMSVLFVLYIAMHNISILKKMKVLFFGFLILAGISLFFYYSEILSLPIFNRFVRLRDYQNLVLSTSSSTGIRLNIVAPSLINDWLKHPILGNGIANGSDLFQFNDIGYLFYLRTFGIIGALILLSLYLTVYKKINKILIPQKFVFGTFVKILLLLLSFKLLTQGFGLVRITPIIWMFAGIALNPLNKLSIDKNINSPQVIDK